MTGFSIPHAFSVGSIRAHAPAASGVYGIANRREWIYIGETDNIQQRLLEHASESSDSDLLSHAPSGFAYEICGASARAGRQDRLIQQYEPVCNRQPGRRDRRRTQ